MPQNALNTSSPARPSGVPHSAWHCGATCDSKRPKREVQPSPGPETEVQESSRASFLSLLEPIWDFSNHSRPPLGRLCRTMFTSISKDKNKRIRRRRRRDKRTNEQADECTNERTCEQTNKRKIKRTLKRTSTRTNERTDGRTNERPNDRTNEQTNEQRSEHMNYRMDERNTPSLRTYTHSLPSPRPPPSLQGLSSHEHLKVFKRIGANASLSKHGGGLCAAAPLDNIIIS